MKKVLNGLWLLAFLSMVQLNINAQCNGDPGLCSKTYDQVVYATTHNAFNYSGPFQFPNQTYSVAQQLQDGVRGLMLDVHWYNNQPTLMHNYWWLGNQPLHNVLLDIKSFLDQNPNEVVTIIFESYITSVQMDSAFSQAGLYSYLHSQSLSQPWPTLQDMITANKRLVVFVDVNDGPTLPWYHYVWDYAVETHFTAYTRTDFSCNFNRGNASNDLFILNHFITNQSLGYGMPDSAQAINSNPYLLSRATQCWTETGKIPNFLTVDFYEKGNVFETVDALNNPVAVDEIRTSEIFSVWPNPSAGIFNVRFGSPLQKAASLRLIDATGKVVLDQVSGIGATEVILFPKESDMAEGIYLLEVRCEKDYAVKKLVYRR